MKRTAGDRIDGWLGWLLAVTGVVVYGLTMERTVSWWDCGEFMATSRWLEVGHPPGAPMYSLLAHCMMLLGGAETAALWSNGLSALAGGLTCGFMYWTLRLMGGEGWKGRVGSAVGVLCYLFCDTAWFSATESEVYALATLVASVAVWCTMRWAKEEERSRAPRWLLAAVAVTAMGVGVHQLVLLTVPAMAVIYVWKVREMKKEGKCSRRRNRRLLVRVGLPALIVVAMGLSVYMMVPIRAKANTPINEGNPSTVESFKKYLRRDTYAKAPLWPRSWKMRKGDEGHYKVWRRNGGDVELLLTYQMGYMYGRYLMWNFAGRFSNEQGFGSAQDGQMATGIGPVDKILVGTMAKVPDKMMRKSHNVYYLLPLALGIFGMVWQWRRRRWGFWTIMALFLTGGVVLGIYLNHPVYEPRERDYAYVLSFYAFAMWIGVGAEGLQEMLEQVKRKRGREIGKWAVVAVAVAAPVLMACQNWDDHDRSQRKTARDTARNLLESCDQDAILISYGDNDTFPLWYVQEVERYRRDVTLMNVNLAGGSPALYKLLAENNWERPVYFTHYMANAYSKFYTDRLRLEGNVYRLCEGETDAVGVEEFLRHLENMKWEGLDKAYIDPLSRMFLEQYWRDVLVLTDTFIEEGRMEKAHWVLDKTRGEIPLDKIGDLTIVLKVAESYKAAGDGVEGEKQKAELRERVAEWKKYYSKVSRGFIKYMTHRTSVLEEVSKAVEK